MLNHGGGGGGGGATTLTIFYSESDSDESNDWGGSLVGNAHSIPHNVAGACDANQILL